MSTLSRRLRSWAVGAAALLLAAGLAGCVGISVPGSPPPAQGEDDPAVSGPAGPGTGSTADCPDPGAGARVELATAEAAQTLLQVALPETWCLYKSTSYYQFYALPFPTTSTDDFGADVRAALEPAGWSFDPLTPEDEPSEWSWITGYPAGSEAGFTDGAIDGAIFTTPSLTEEQYSGKYVWYAAMIDTFGVWPTGAPVAIVGFW